MFTHQPSPEWPGRHSPNELIKLVRCGISIKLTAGYDRALLDLLELAVRVACDSSPVVQRSALLRHTGSWVCS